MMMKSYNSCRFTKVSFLFLFLFLFLFSFVSASSAIKSEIPDLCLTKDVSYYDIWLEDYYSIDLNEEIKIHYHDPVNGNLLTLPSGHSSLNDECFEIAYYFQNRTPTTPTTDLLRLKTFDDTCTSSIKVKFYDTEGIDQTFELNISDSCNISSPEYQPVIVNESYLPPLVSYHQFENSLQDSYSSKDLAFFGSGQTYASSKSGNGYYSAGTSTANFEGVLTDETWTISFWLKSSDLGGVILYSDHFNFQQNSGQYDFFDFHTTNALDYSGYFHHFLFSYEDGLASFYFDGSLVASTSTAETGAILEDLSFGGLNGSCSYAEGFCVDGYYDELAIFDEALNSSQASFLYNSGTGLFFDSITFNLTPVSTPLADIFMNGSKNFTINLDGYFSNWEDIYVKVPDPINYYNYQIWTGYSTLNADFFEVELHNNGTLRIQSYERPFNFTIEAYACNGTNLEYCSNRNFTVFINSEISEVLQLSSFEYPYNLGLDGSKTYSGNEYFQYYETIIFSYPETNSTGVLTSDFPFNYIALENSSEQNSAYMVYVNCSINQPEQNYYFLGDIGVNLTCGSFQSYYTLTPNEKFQRTVWFHASNRKGELSDNTLLIGGYAPGSVPYGSEISSDTDSFNKYANSLDPYFPEDVDPRTKSNLVFVVFSLVLIPLFSFVLKKAGIEAAILVSFGGFLFISFVFVSLDYMEPRYPILIFFIFIGYLAIKFKNGGS